MAYPLDPTAQGFSLPNALACALAAQVAYNPDADVDATAKNDWGFNAVTHYASPPSSRLYETHAFVAVRSDVILVVFRGTDPRNIKDWLTDGDIVMAPTRLGHVHAGFWRAFGSVWPAMLTDITGTLKTGGRPLWFAGHSLGAALSTLAVASCWENKLVPAGHYTFGSPRVADSSFVNSYNERFGSVSFRFVNNQDIVTRVPPRELQYDHVDFRKYFDRDGLLVADMRMFDLVLDSFQGTILGLRKVFDQLAIQKDLPLPDFIQDHFIANYIDCIKKNLP